MKIPFKYTFRNFKARKLTAIITVSGIAMVVFVFAAALMMAYGCLLYTSDAADERSSVDLGGRRIIKKTQHGKRGEQPKNKTSTI